MAEAEQAMKPIIALAAIVSISLCLPSFAGPKEDARHMQALDYLEQGLDAEEEDDYQAAIRLYTKGISIYPDAGLYQARCSVYHYLEEFEKAMNDCVKAVRIDPKEYLALGTLAARYVQYNEYDNAIINANRALAIKDSEWQYHVYESRSTAYLMKGNFQQAYEDKLMAIHRVKGTGSESLTEMVDNWFEATARMRAFYMKDKADPVRQFYMGLFLYHDEEYETAMQHVEWLLDHGHQEGRVYFLKALIHDAKWQKAARQEALQMACDKGLAEGCRQLALLAERESAPQPATASSNPRETNNKRP
jgi:tetratricopeptide (TPR) repeat protein